MERLNAVLPIRDIFSRVILNCCGQSALETEVLAGEDVVGRVSVPGNGREDPDVRADAEYINTVIAGELTGENIFDQERIDGILSVSYTHLTGGGSLRSMVYPRNYFRGFF